jgi:hypothetical protein
MAAVLAITAMPTSEKLGEMVHDASLKPENGNDEWLSKALLAAAINHENGFRAASAKLRLLLLRYRCRVLPIVLIKH